MNIRNHYPQFLYYNLVMNRHLFKDHCLSPWVTPKFLGESGCKGTAFF